MSQAPSEFKDYWALVNRDVRFSHTAFIFFFFFCIKLWAYSCILLTLLDFCLQSTEDMIYDPEIYRQQMEYQYIIDGDGQSGEMLFAFTSIHHYGFIALCWGRLKTNACLWKYFKR